MANFKDLSGKKFGRLTVLSTDGKTNSGGYKWKCVCTCGTEKTIPSDHLLRKSQPVLSCGCFRDDQIRKTVTSPDKVAFNLLVGSYRKRAKLKNRSFKLTEVQFRHLTSSNCSYCGQLPSQISKNKPKTGRYFFNGIDRINSNLGYEFSNCVPCCKNCNYMKRNLSKQEFLAHIERISHFQREVHNG